MKNYKIPFCKRTGEMMVYPAAWVDIKWVEPYEFEAEMKFDAIERGRSAARCVFEDIATKKKYRIFMKDISDILKQDQLTIQGGVISGKWGFCKRGENYGIKLVEVRK